ncbi:hypothetical protein SAPIO_CDS3599 [Scedosporium apiospermum]|uniref:Probable endonuclease LCL3 n=1 Tax=Pseudallescheria apiosperma TaxID=563466 RepID=A0A084GB55_PSEDA|nr:uncharacterized protein SAPIO_CDS3599 [Scedosporium apiospermum]KEZ44567.1 hypothetical protein SAPIO_CDS3599 [Scedosporium apiospermum]
MAPWPFNSSSPPPPPPPPPPSKEEPPKPVSLSDYLPDDERLRILVPTVLSTVGILSLIPIRLAGIDAPEGAHFGRPAQPFADAALSWLTSSILHRRVRAHIHKRDQYDRVVATVYVRRGGIFSFLFPFFLHRDVGLEMLKRGLATTYEAKSGVEFGGREKAYKAAEAKAKAKKVGMWSMKASEFESPRAYKARIRDGEASGTGS